MRRRVTLALAALVGVAPALAGAAPAAAHGNDHRNTDQHGGNLVFVQLNNINGNAVRVFQRADDGMGTLTQVGPDVPTGGLGGTVVGAPTDPLQSQNSLVFSNGLLFAVNAGSNTVTVFHVDGTQLVQRQVIPSGGQFPTSIAVRDNLVFVANGGGAGAIQGYRLENGMLQMIPDDNRPLGLDTSNPPIPVFPTSIGQVGISPNGQWAFVTMVGGVVDANPNNVINAFRIGNNGVLSDSRVASPSVGGLPFGFTFQTPNRLVVAEAGAADLTTYKRVGQGHLTPIASVPNGQVAPCWVLQVGEFYYTVNTGNNTISSFRVQPNGQPVIVPPNPAGTTDAAPIDPTESGGFLYVQSSSGGFIAVFQVNSNGTLTPKPNVTGLPVFDPTADEPTGMEGIAAS